MPHLPSGTVAFLFTDIEGSTRRWQKDPRLMAAAVARHDELLRDIVTRNGGAVFKTVGDAFCTAFHTTLPAMTTAVEAQRALNDEPWGEIGPIRVRMAIHVGDAEERDSDYFGPAVNRVARLLSAGHGGQVLLSSIAAGLVGDNLPPDHLIRDLGEHYLKDLVRPEHIYQLVIPALESDFPPIVTQHNRPNNLPPQLTQVIGRDREKGQILDLLRDESVRLVTLTGPGGVGKTRLSLLVGSDALTDYPDGVWFVALEQSTDEAAVTSAVASALGARETKGLSPEQALIEHITDKRLLLILDNFEQVVHAAPLLTRLLRAAPGLQIVITSRTRLGLQGEREIGVPALDVPDRGADVSLDEIGNCSAVALFVERARAAKPGFALTDANARAVTELCRGLDSLPLAIELAAARVKLLPPEAMLVRMGQRLGLLTGGRGDRPERHQTLRATIAWSYDLLQPDDQVLFARLSVFAGGFTPEAAQDVCDPDFGLDILTGIEALLDHSLIRASEDAADEIRFTMLTTIREYAAECLAQQDNGPTHERHVDWCLSMVEEADAALKGPSQQQWLDRLEIEHDNIRAALTWSQAEGRLDDSLRLASAMGRFWEMHGHFSEGRRWLAGATSAPPSMVTAAALSALGSLMVQQGEHNEAVGIFERSLEIFRTGTDDRGTADALHGLAGARLRQGKRAEAQRHYAASKSLYESAQDSWGAASAIRGLAAVARDAMEYARAQELYERAAATFESLGDRRNLAVCLNNLATVAHDRKDYDRASVLYERAAELIQTLHDRRTLAITLNNRGIVAHDQGAYDQAEALYEESLAIFRDLGDRRSVAYLLLGLGIVADDQADYTQAVTYLEESLGIFDDLGDQHGVASVRTNLATTLLHLREIQRAKRLAMEALAFWLDDEDPEGMVESLDCLAKIAIHEGQYELGVGLFAAGADVHDAEEISLSPAGQAEYDRMLADARTGLGDEDFARIWAAGRLVSPEGASSDVLAERARS